MLSKLNLPMEKIKLKFSDEKIIHVAGMDGEIFDSLQIKHGKAIVEIDNQKSAYFSMNFEEIITELKRIGWKNVEIKQEILSVQKKCNHDAHVQKGNMWFAKQDNELANHKKGQMICGYCGYHGKY
jgi:C-terminal processing protease CtpA/Prc